MVSLKEVLGHISTISGGQSKSILRIHSNFKKISGVVVMTQELFLRNIKSIDEKVRFIFIVEREDSKEIMGVVFNNINSPSAPMFDNRKANEVNWGQGDEVKPSDTHRNINGFSEKEYSERLNIFDASLYIIDLRMYCINLYDRPSYVAQRMIQEGGVYFFIEAKEIGNPEEMFEIIE